MYLFLLQINPYMFKSFGFSPLKLKSAENQQIFLQILTLWIKIKKIAYAKTNLQQKNI
jgi:hypothetical protein